MVASSRIVRCVAALLFSGSLLLGQGVITTVAGNGRTGFAGDGGPATQASFNQPFVVALDSRGNLLIGDTSNGRVRRVTSDGIVITVAGGGSQGEGAPATSASLGSVHGIAADLTGNVFISTVGPQRVWKVTPDGILRAFAGTGAGGYSGDGGAAATAQFNNPDGLAVDNAGNVYIADVNNRRVRKVTTTGQITTFAGNGVRGFSGDGGPATGASLSLSFGSSLAMARDNSLYIADAGNHRIRKVDPTGIISSVAGNGSSGFSGDGGPALQASLAQPSSVLVDGQGNLYIADYGNHRVRVVRGDGRIVTVAGSGSTQFSGDGGFATLAGVRFPTSIATDGAGGLYVADAANNRVRRVTFDGSIVTVGQSLGAPGKAVRLPLNLATASGASIDRLAVTVKVMPDDNAPGPVVTMAMSFETGPGIPLAPVISAQGGAGLITLTWAALGINASGLVKLGDIVVQIPDAAKVGQAYLLTILQPSAGLGLASTLVLAGPTASLGVTISNPVPTITSLEPTSALTGSPTMTLKVNGTGFVPASVVRFNGSDRLTSFVGTNQVIAAITDTDLSSPGIADVRVFTPPPDGGLSNSTPFEIRPLITIATGGIVDGASFTPGKPIAPGGIASVFGGALSASSQSATNYPLPRSLGASSLMLDEFSAPLFFASPTQLNFQVPWELAGRNVVRATVLNGAAISNVVSVSLGTYSPGLFTVGGTRQGAVLISGTASLAAPTDSYVGARPVGRGEYVSIFCAGLGPVTNTPTSGDAAKENPLSATTLYPAVSIGGIAASVSFAGLAPGFVGLYQVNVQVPAAAPTGNTIALLLTVGGVTSNTVTIAIQ